MGDVTGSRIHLHTGHTNTDLLFSYFQQINVQCAYVTCKYCCKHTKCSESSVLGVPYLTTSGFDDRVTLVGLNMLWRECTVHVHVVR